MHYRKIVLIDEIEFDHCRFTKIPLETMHHILILELRVWCIIINNRKQGHFITQKADDNIICGWVDVLNLLLKTILLQYNHLILKHITVVLFQQLLVGKIDTQLLKRIIPKILESENIQ